MLSFIQYGFISSIGNHFTEWTFLFCRRDKIFYSKSKKRNIVRVKENEQLKEELEFYKKALEDAVKKS